MTTHDSSAVFTRPQNSYCMSTTGSSSSVINVATTASYPVYPLVSKHHFDLGGTTDSAAAVTNVASSPTPHDSSCTTPSATSSTNSPQYMIPPPPGPVVAAITTAQNEQLSHHPPPQLTRSNSGYTTYYSTLPLDQLPSNCTPYPLPTPPLTAPIHPLRSYFFPTVVGQQFKPDDIITNKPPNHPSTGVLSPAPDTSYSNNHETLATALLQLQEPVIRASVPSATLVSFSQSSITSPISTFSNVPYSVQSPWRPSWPYLPIMQQEYRGNPCHICGKTYARISTLRSHLKSHTGEKPYQCSICQKSFTQAANLTAHLRTHSGEKPFKCPVCHRGFSQSSSVTTHMRTHSGDRPYKCNVCSKGFADSSTLTKHYRTHTGEKPYHCKICEARFSQSGNLNRHMRTHQQHFGMQHIQEPMQMDMGGVSVGVSIGDYTCSSTDMSKLEMVVLNEGRV